MIQDLYELVDLYIGKDNVNTIVEAGACDCQDSLKLAEEYKHAHIYAFECNPETIPLCKEAIKGEKRITLTEKALSDKKGEVAFFPIDTKKTITTHDNGNPGASSLFRASPDYPTETYVQNKIIVESIRLKDFLDDLSIPEIDILWLDAQGAELSILKGLEDRIKDVKVIKTEVLFKEQYISAPLFDELVDYLESNNFRFVRFMDKYEYFGDCLFIREDL